MFKLATQKTINNMVRLRICTFKSVADFYYRSEWTVEKLWLDNPIFVLRVYYEYEKISFNEDVLHCVKEKYPNFFRIEKPGKFDGDWKSIVLGQIGTDWKDKTYQELLKAIKGFKINNRPVPDELLRCFLNAKSKHTTRKDNANLSVSKADLQGRNHGR